MNQALLLVAMAQIAVLYFISGPRYLRMLAQACHERNPDWLAAHPRILARARAAGRLAALPPAAGALWLFWLVNSTGASPHALIVAPILAWSALESLCAFAVYALVYRRIKAPARRVAVMHARTVEVYAHPLAVAAPCLLLALEAGLYVQAWMRGLLEPVVLWTALGALALGALLAALALRHALRRRLPDEGARRRDVLELLGCLWLFGLFHLYYLAYAVWSLPVLNGSGFFIVVSVAVQSVALLGLRYPRPVTTEETTCKPN